MPGEIEKVQQKIKNGNIGTGIKADSDGIPRQSLSEWKGGQGRYEKCLKQLEATYGHVESAEKLCVRVPGR